jgi:hypothetical protein
MIRQVRQAAQDNRAVLEMHVRVAWLPFKVREGCYWSKICRDMLVESMSNHAYVILGQAETSRHELELFPRRLFSVGCKAESLLTTYR